MNGLFKGLLSMFTTCSRCGKGFELSRVQFEELLRDPGTKVQCPVCYQRQEADRGTEMFVEGEQPW